MRLTNVLVGAVLVAAASGCGGAAEGRSAEGEGAAACAEPIVPATPAEVRAGDEVSLALTDLPRECRDGDPDPAIEERPVADLEVIFVQGDTRRTVRDVRGTGTTYDGSVTVVVPEDAVPGPASVSIGGAAGAGFTVLP